MRQFPSRLLLLIVLSIPLFQYGQSLGSSHLQKAKQHIALGKYAKANRHLNKALKADYGFCGNAYLNAKEEIFHCRIQMLPTQNQPRKALKNLDKISCEMTTCEVTDSLRVAILTTMYGKQTVATGIESALEHVPDNYFPWVEGEFELMVDFHPDPIVVHTPFDYFRYAKEESIAAEQQGTPLSPKQQWLVAMKKMPFYTQLKD